MSGADVHADVVIVGAGPAGLAAAIELRRRGVEHVVVLEREAEAGGVPRHTRHLGFGLRDMRRVLDGPAYAARYVRLAAAAGVELRTGTSVTGWADAPATDITTPSDKLADTPTVTPAAEALAPAVTSSPNVPPSDVTPSADTVAVTPPAARLALAVTSPAGRGVATGRAVLLATGCRERPRTARLVPGSRPLGVLTTGALQQLVYLQHQRVGELAVIVGAEHVSFSAVLTLAHGGARTVAMTTELPRHQTYAALAWMIARRRRVPVLTSTAVTRILGERRVEAVELTDLTTGAPRRLGCDTVVFTGDWIPDHELARAGGVAMDQATRAPRIDCALRTSVRGVFAAGNLLHAAETADVAALSGRHAADAIDAFLRSAAWPARPSVPIVCEPPLRWISPSAIETPATTVPHGRFLLRVDQLCGRAVLEVRQDDRVLWRERRRELVPARSIRVSAAWVTRVDADAGVVSVTLRS